MRSSTTLFAALSVLFSIMTPTIQLPAPLPAPAPKPEMQGRNFVSRFAPKARPVFPRVVFDNYTTKRSTPDKRDALPEPVPVPIAEPEANPAPAPVPEAQPEALPQPIPEAQPEAQPIAQPEAIPEPAPQPQPEALPEAVPQPEPVAAAEPNPVAIAQPGPEAHVPHAPGEKRDADAAPYPIEERNIPGHPFPTLPPFPTIAFPHLPRNLPPLPTASIGVGIHL